MNTDRLTKTCLVMIVLMMGLMTYNQNIAMVRAAPPAEYMIEGNSGQQPDALNAHMRKRVSEGWTLHTFGLNYLVWQK